MVTILLVVIVVAVQSPGPKDLFFWIVDTVNPQMWDSVVPIYKPGLSYKLVVWATGSCVNSIRASSTNPSQI